MKLITKEIKKRLEKYPLYSQDGKKEEAICQAKFFLCVGAWSWFILEADLENNIAYGITINGSGEGEYGYTSLNRVAGTNNEVRLNSRARYLILPYSTKGY
jgi:hypothetical protein